MDDPVWWERYFIAYKLGISIDAVMEMPVPVFCNWLGFFKKMPRI